MYNDNLPSSLNLRINKVRPGLKHLPALIQVLCTVVNAANAADLMRQAFLYPVGVVAFLIEQCSGSTPEAMNNKIPDVQIQRPHRAVQRCFGDRVSVVVSAGNNMRGIHLHSFAEDTLFQRVVVNFIPCRFNQLRFTHHADDL